MARELYNWNQSRGYMITAAISYNKKNNQNKINIDELIKEYDILQTQIGKEGVEGYSKLLLKNI